MIFDEEDGEEQQPHEEPSAEQNAKPTEEKKPSPVELFNAALQKFIQGYNTNINNEILFKDEIKDFYRLAPQQNPITASDAAELILQGFKPIYRAYRRVHLFGGVEFKDPAERKRMENALNQHIQYFQKTLLTEFANFPNFIEII